MSKSTLNLRREFLDLPKHPKRILPKFDLENSHVPEDNINNFPLALRLMNVKHEDMVCIILPYTFEKKAYTWYYSLPIGSITS
jgi:hypothetical protein